MPADGAPRLLTDDREQRLVVGARIVHAGDQMRGTRPRGRDADAELAGEFRVGRGHEGRHFLVPRLNELDLVAGAVQGPENAVDPVSRVAEHAAHAPCVKAGNDEVADGLRHGFVFLVRGLSLKAANPCARQWFQLGDQVSAPIPATARAPAFCSDVPIIALIWVFPLECPYI